MWYIFIYWDFIEQFGDSKGRGKQFCNLIKALVKYISNTSKTEIANNTLALCFLQNMYGAIPLFFH